MMIQSINNWDNKAKEQCYELEKNVLKRLVLVNLILCDKKRKVFGEGSCCEISQSRSKDINMNKIFYIFFYNNLNNNEEKTS